MIPPYSGFPGLQFHETAPQSGEERRDSATRPLVVHPSKCARRTVKLYAEHGRNLLEGETRETEHVCTAYHEAAHALTVHGLGGFVTNVDSDGQTSYAWPPKPVGGALGTERMRDMVRAVVLYSGPVAEDLVRRPAERPGTVAMVQACRTLPYLQEAPGQDPHHDFDRVAEIVRGRFGSDSDAIFPFLTAAARLAEELVRTHWKTIERVAHHTLRCGSVDGRVFRSLVAPQLRRGDLLQRLEEARFR